MRSYEAPEKTIVDDSQLRWDELGPSLVAGELGNGQAAAHSENRNSGEDRSADGPYSQRPAQADLLQQNIEYEGEYEA